MTKKNKALTLPLKEKGKGLYVGKIFVIIV